MSAGVFTKQYSENLEALIHLNGVAEKLYRSNPRNKNKHSMDISSEVVLQLLKSLNQHQVQYLLVGGMAGVVHGYIRTTLDMDLWIGNTRENTEAFVQALLANDFDGIPFRVIHLRDLIKEKKASAKKKDLADVEELQRIWEEQWSLHLLPSLHRLPPGRQHNPFLLNILPQFRVDHG
ncbi:hypothetical protein GCM10007423_60500 [Dyadobacter endophyticus]|uniref:Uncharacterized protein n=1 Tax=Dyadobacter endophyticus TaxID=1749036 RepID=A0ABQ1ZCC3_9BACT|nr:hypothetical protein [Dyadobacter endophyticus]GGH54208.1 hypothetical protein GCM10007423_60500 [Dyadobacter endophyticus]